MDKKKIIIISSCSLLGLALLALMVLWIAVKIKEKKVYGGSGNPDLDISNTTGSTNTNGLGLPIFPLRWGSGSSSSKNVQISQSYVRNLQVFCNSWVHAGLVKDGIWGSKTETALQRLKVVMYYQKAGSGQVNTTDVFAQNIVTIPGTSRVQIPSLASYNKMEKWHRTHVGQSYTFLV